MTDDFTFIFVLMGSGHVKGKHKMWMKLTPVREDKKRSRQQEDGHVRQILGIVPVPRSEVNHYKLQHLQKSYTVWQS